MKQIGKPKPEKKGRKKKKNVRRGICVRCGFIYQTTKEHLPNCPDGSVTIAFDKANNDRQLLDAALNHVVKEIVLLRDGECVCPPPENGHSDVLQPGHIVTRAAKSVKWDLLNVHEQCSSCNINHEHRPEIYIDWFSNKFGEEERRSLVARSRERYDLAVYEMSELLSELNKIYESQRISPDWKPYFTQADILSGAWRNV